MTQLGMPVPQPGQFVQEDAQAPSVAVEEQPQDAAESKLSAQKMVASSTLVISPEELEQQYAQWHREMGAEAQDSQPEHGHGSDTSAVKHVHVSDGPKPDDSDPKSLRQMGDDEQLDSQRAESAHSSWSDDENVISVPSASLAPSWSDVVSHTSEPNQSSETNLDAGYSADWGFLDADVTEHIRRPASPENGAWKPILMLGCVVTIVGIGFLGYLRLQPTQFSVTFGAAQAVTQGDRVHLTVPVESSEAVNLSYPGGMSPISGHGKLRFSVPTDTIPLKRKTMPLTTEGEHTKLTQRLQLDGFYRIRPVSVSTTELESTLIHREGWSIEVEPGRLKRLDGNSYQWIVSFEKMPKTIEATVTMRDGAGRTEVFKDRFEVPLAVVLIVVTHPPNEAIHESPSVTIAGMTVPNARIRLHGDTTVADEKGAFKHVISIERNGDHRIPLEVESPGLHPRTLELMVRRRPAGASSARNKAAKQKAQQAMVKSKKRQAIVLCWGRGRPRRHQS